MADRFELTEHAVVIAFPGSSEADEDRELDAAFERERDLEARAESIAELLYNARAAYTDSRCMVWSMLTPGQRLGYLREAITLIRGF